MLLQNSMVYGLLITSEATVSLTWKLGDETLLMLLFLFIREDLLRHWIDIEIGLPISFLQVEIATR